MTETTTLWSSNHNDHHGHCHHHYSSSSSSHGWKSSSSLSSSSTSSNRSSQSDLFRPVNVNDDNFQKSSSTSNKLNRSLFGQTDPIETKRLLYEQMNSRRVIDRNRWNFDFHTEKPFQSGRYEWHKLTAKQRSNSNSPTPPTTPQSPFDYRRTPSPKFFSNHDGKYNFHFSLLKISILSNGLIHFG